MNQFIVVWEYFPVVPNPCYSNLEKWEGKHGLITNAFLHVFGAIKV